MILEMKQEHVDEVVSIHKSVLGDTFNAKVGSKYLKKLYSIVIKQEENKCALVYVNKEDKVAGFITACLDIQKLENKIKLKLGFINFLRIFLQIICQKGIIKDLFERIRFSNYLKKKYKSPYATILTVGIKQGEQRKGIGGKLIEQITEFFKEHDLSSYKVDTEISNKNAIKFYENHDFKKIDQFSDNVVFSKNIILKP